MAPGERDQPAPPKRTELVKFQMTPDAKLAWLNAAASARVKRGLNTQQYVLHLLDLDARDLASSGRSVLGALSPGRR